MTNQNSKPFLNGFAQYKGSYGIISNFNDKEITIVLDKKVITAPTKDFTNIGEFNQNLFRTLKNN